MKNKEKMQQVRDFAMELSNAAGGLADVRVVGLGDVGSDALPKQPKKKEIQAFGDGVAIAAALFAWMLDNGVRFETAGQCLTQAVEIWISGREEARG